MRVGEKRWLVRSVLRKTLTTAPSQSSACEFRAGRKQWHRTKDDDPNIISSECAIGDGVVRDGGVTPVRSSGVGVHDQERGCMVMQEVDHRAQFCGPVNSVHCGGVRRESCRSAVDACMDQPR